MREVWIEAALNGAWGRRRQPLIPITPAEIIAEGIEAARNGAGIVHIHAYDPETRRQRDDWDIYARIIEGIRREVDAIVYPTIPLAGASYASHNSEKRFAHIMELAKRGLIEWMALDPGSVNFTRYDAIGSFKEAFVYENTPNDIAEGVRVACEYGLRPGYAIYEPGFARLGAALAQKAPAIPTPVYRFMFTEEFAWGFPPEETYLDTYLHLLKELAPRIALDDCGTWGRHHPAHQPRCPAWRLYPRRIGGRPLGHANDQPDVDRHSGSLYSRCRARACFRRLDSRCIKKAATVISASQARVSETYFRQRAEW